MAQFIELTNPNRDKVYINLANLIGFYKGKSQAYTALCLVHHDAERTRNIEFVVEHPEQILKKIKDESRKGS